MTSIYQATDSMPQGPFLPTFVELPPFERFREDYLNDDDYRLFQTMLLSDPEAGDVIRGTGGLRKVRFEDKLRGKGKRGCFQDSCRTNLLRSLSLSCRFALPFPVQPDLVLQRPVACLA